MYFCIFKFKQTINPYLPLASATKLIVQLLNNHINLWFI